MRALRPFQHLKSDDRGAALVEFAILLPTLLLFFALIIEGSRTFWSYQAAIAGVRDATRFVARAEAVSVCENGATVARWESTVTGMVRNTSDGARIFPPSITVTAVKPTLACIAGNFRRPVVPMVTVTATLHIDYPFAGLFRLAGLNLGPATTTIADTTRIYGS